MKPIQNMNKSNQIDQFIFNDLNNEQGNQGKLSKTEDRQPVTDTTCHPYNAIGKIISRFSNENFNLYDQVQGTGALIGQRLVLTSAHVISLLKNIGNNQKRSFISDEIYFFPGNNGNKIKIINYWINDKYFSTLTLDKSKYDFALLELEPNNIIKNNQTIKMNFDYKYQQMKNKIINITGYPNKQTIQFKAQSLAKRQQHGLLYYKITTQGGNSGGPVLLKIKQNQYQIIGVNKGMQKNHNYCVILSCFKQAKQIIGEIIQSHNLQEKLKQIYQPSSRLIIQKLQKEIEELKLLNSRLLDQINQIRQMNMKRQNRQKIRILSQESQSYQQRQKLLIKTSKDNLNHNQLKNQLLVKYKNDESQLNQSYTTNLVSNFNNPTTIINNMRSNGANYSTKGNKYMQDLYQNKHQSNLNGLGSKLQRLRDEIKRQIDSIK